MESDCIVWRLLAGFGWILEAGTPDLRLLGGSVVLAAVCRPGAVEAIGGVRGSGGG